MNLAKPRRQVGPSDPPHGEPVRTAAPLPPSSTGILPAPAADVVHSVRPLHPVQQPLDRSAEPNSKRLVLGTGKHSGIQKVGALRFPHSPRFKATKWACVKETADVARLRDELLLSQAFGMPEPNVLISVHGSANDDPTLFSVAAEIKRGVHDAVQTTGAWVTTSGISTGVSALVGQALRDIPSAVCLGFPPWRTVVGRRKLGAMPDGRVYKYTHVDREVGDGTGSLSLLEMHHTHFLLVADEQDEAAQRTTVISHAALLRGELEEAMCPDNLDDEDNIAVPMIVLIAGGGPTALRAAHDAVCKLDRPVVIVAEVDGASSWIYRTCFGREAKVARVLSESVATRKPNTFATVSELARTASYLPESPDGLMAAPGAAPPNRLASTSSLVRGATYIAPTQQQTAAATYIQKVARSCIGRLAVKMLSDIRDKFDADPSVVQCFSLADSVSLRDVILRALLNDCEATGESALDAIQLAVSWQAGN